MKIKSIVLVSALIGVHGCSSSGGGGSDKPNEQKPEPTKDEPTSLTPPPSEDTNPDKPQPQDPEPVIEMKDAQGRIRFAYLYKNLIETSCLKCHGDSQEEHVKFTNYSKVKLFAAGITERLESPGESRMPPINGGVPVPSKELINAFKKWYLVDDRPNN